MRPSWLGVCGWQFTGPGDHPTGGDAQVIRRTTTWPVRSIKEQRAADRCSHFLDHLSHINRQTCVTHYPDTVVMPMPGGPVLAGGGDRVRDIGIIWRFAA